MLICNYFKEDRNVMDAICSKLMLKILERFAISRLTELSHYHQYK